jgi:CDGSH-type Zn-finger protein/truncated hemoglobin YjbI
MSATSRIEPLLARASRLSRAVSRGAPYASALKPLVALFQESERAFTAATREPSDFVASRLLESVLRPLAGAVTGRAIKPDPGGKRPARETARLELNTSGLDDVLWQLAQDATKLRAGWQGAPAQVALLMEATAALQHLSVGLASALGSEVRTLRLEKLYALQRRCEGGIRCARNGPYLVTNAERMLNWLGEEMPVQPQMALCRCGESAIKPHCDGACARTGFRDGKDPKRVPDQRDTFEGEQLTVFDNRGICQHSGFCSDRLNTVFHTEGVFVTPSGGRMDEIIRAVRDCPSGALSYAIDKVEARAQVDWHGGRAPTIEVSKDGPYRIRGSIPLTDEQGVPVKRAVGSSLEHYALCRCGHSQNKPFCSGMHWYVEFHDPTPDNEQAPTIFEWAGGLPALTRMTRLFYEKHVPADPLLAPLFATMSPDHPDRVAKWLAEVFCGPRFYSDQYGGYPRMLSQHRGRRLTDEQRTRWVALLLQSAREAGLPNDPEFRSAFAAYIEWGSRLAVENSQTGAKPPAHMPMPRWDWNTAAGPPGSRISALASQDDPQEAKFVPPKPGETPSFDTHIKPLFRESDRRSMQFAFDLWNHDDVTNHADAILSRLRAGTMPCDGAWPDDQVDLFEQWLAAGKPK